MTKLAINSPNKGKRRYIFDDPEDIELNTVPDSDKKLCLSSGEIKLADLAVASSVTFFRDGMMYLAPGNLGLTPFINCGIKRLSQLSKLVTANISGFGPANVVFEADGLLVGLLFEKDDKSPPPPQFLALIPNLLTRYTILSTGDSYDNDGRAVFNQYIGEKMRDAGLEPSFPEGSLSFDFSLHDGGFMDLKRDGEPVPQTGRGWMDNAAEYEIIVDSIQHGFLAGGLLTTDNVVGLSQMY